MARKLTERQKTLRSALGRISKHNARLRKKYFRTTDGVVPPLSTEDKRYFDLAAELAAMTPPDDEDNEDESEDTGEWAKVRTSLSSLNGT